jgi:[ribosomal protein S5]-alanine N-acetyltransferase
MKNKDLKLVAINQSGNPEEKLDLSEIGKQVAAANVENYVRNGFQKPWCAYFAVIDGVVVGSCAFKTPVQNQKVEIAYFTFPKFEGRGIASQMAACLIQVATNTDKSVLVTAQTLPEKNASTSILSKLGFVMVRTLTHPEDGLVWEWELNSKSLENQ